MEIVDIVGVAAGFWLVSLFWLVSFLLAIATDRWLKKVPFYPPEKTQEEITFPYVLYCLGFWIPSVPVVLATMGLYFGSKALFSKVQTLVQGASMRKFLFKYLLTAALGAGVWESGAITKTYQWFTAPPAPPSREAQKLIASLEEGSGWEASNGKDGPGTLTKGNVSVVAGNYWNYFRACIRVNGTEADAEFGWTDRRAIDGAARQCLRKVTAREMDKIEAAQVDSDSKELPKGFKVTQNDNSVTLKLPSGATYQFSKYRP